MFNTPYPRFGGELYASNKTVSYPVEHKADSVIIQMLQAILMLLRGLQGNDKVDISLEAADIEKITNSIIADLDKKALLTKTDFDATMGTVSNLGSYTKTKDIVNALNGIYTDLKAAIGNINVKVDLSIIEASLKSITEKVAKLDNIDTLLGEASDYTDIKADSQNNASNVPTALKNIIDAIKAINIPKPAESYDDAELRKTLITLATGTTPTNTTDYTWDKVAAAFKNSESDAGNNIKTLLTAIENITAQGGSGVHVDLTNLWKALYVMVEGKEKSEEKPTYDITDFVGLFESSTTKPSLDYIAGQIDTINGNISDIDTKINTITSTQPIYNYTVSIDDPRNISISIGSLTKFKLYYFPHYEPIEITQTDDNNKLIYNTKDQLEGLSISNNKFVYNGVVQGLIPQTIAISTTIYNKPTVYNEKNEPIGDKVGYRLESIENVYVVGKGASA